MLCHFNVMLPAESGSSRLLSQTALLVRAFQPLKHSAWQSKQKQPLDLVVLKNNWTKVPFQPRIGWQNIDLSLSGNTAQHVSLCVSSGTSTKRLCSDAQELLEHFEQRWELGPFYCRNAAYFIHYFTTSWATSFRYDV